MVKKASSEKASSTSHPKAKALKVATKDVPVPAVEKDCCEGAPIEHYRGEPRIGPGPHCTGNPGALEEETLDDNAPYNRTYGLQH